METTGSTHGSEQRDARQLRDTIMGFSLSSEADTLKQEPAWARSDRNARTLVEEPGLRLTLIGLQQGAELREHHAPGPISIQVVSGRVVLTVQHEERTASAGEIFALEAEVQHAVEALEESFILLTIAKRSPSTTA